MEICSRALAFAAYQSHQERSFLENLCRKFEEKVQLQEKSLQQTVLQANSEITSELLLFFFCFRPLIHPFV